MTTTTSASKSSSNFRLKSMNFGPKQVRLAVASTGWWPEGAAVKPTAFSVEQCLHESSEAGYAGVVIGPRFATSTPKLAKLLQQAKLELAAGWWNGHVLTNGATAEIERLQEYVSILVECGATSLLYGEALAVDPAAADSPLSMRAKLDRDGFAAYGKELNELGRFIKNQDLRLCYRHRLGSVVQSVADIATLVEHTTGEVGLFVDTSYLHCVGDNSGAVLRKQSRRIGFVHCQDVDDQLLATSKAQDWSLAQALHEGVFTVPGEGKVNFAGFFKDLANIKYGGWIVVEGELAAAAVNPLKDAILGREHLEPLLDEHNFVVLDEQR